MSVAVCRLADYGGNEMMGNCREVKNIPVGYIREIDYVTSVEVYDKWNEIPKKAWVCYWDKCGFTDMSNPVKIYSRKDGSNYVNYNGKRYDIDIKDLGVQHIPI